MCTNIIVGNDLCVVPFAVCTFYVAPAFAVCRQAPHPTTWCVQTFFVILLLIFYEIQKAVSITLSIYNTSEPKNVSLFEKKFFKKYLASPFGRGGTRQRDGEGGVHKTKRRGCVVFFVGTSVPDCPF